MIMPSEKRKMGLNGGRAKPKNAIFRAAKKVVEAFKTNTETQVITAMMASGLIVMWCLSEIYPSRESQDYQKYMPSGSIKECVEAKHDGENLLRR